MTAAVLPAGYRLERKRVTWIRTEPRGPHGIPRQVVSHPVLAVLTLPDGTERMFDTSAEALEWLADPGNLA